MTVQLLGFQMLLGSWSQLDMKLTGHLVRICE